MKLWFFIICYLISIVLNADAFATVHRPGMHGSAVNSKMRKEKNELHRMMMMINEQTVVTQLTSAILTYFGFVAFFDRPRGSIDVDENVLIARKSQVEGAGLGLYVTQSLPEGTILGTYPGVLRPTSKFMKKYNRLEGGIAGTYAWRFTDNEDYIDPTDQNGKLGDVCLGGSDDYPLSYFIHEILLRFYSTSTALTRINEPAIGGPGCNVRSDENLSTRQVVFSLSRDVVAGEELFMDYGLTYDRTSYGPPST